MVSVELDIYVTIYERRRSFVKQNSTGAKNAQARVKYKLALKFQKGCT